MMSLSINLLIMMLSQKNIVTIQRSILSCISNEVLKRGRENGTIYKCVKVKLKRTAKLTCKKWEGRKVNTVSADDLEWDVFEH